MICRLFAQQQKKQQLGAELVSLLSSGEYSYLTIVVAFLRSEGVDQLKDALKQFIASGKKTKFIVGISRKVTSYEGLKLLLEIGGEGSVLVFHNTNSAAGIFHPKLYLLEGEKKSAVAIASNNLTESGLFLNYELAIIIGLDPQKQEDQQLLKEINDYVGELAANGDVAKVLTLEFLEKLRESGALEIEEQETDSEQEEEEKAEERLERAARRGKIKGLFGSAPVTGAPAKTKKPPAVAPKPKAAEAASATPKPAVAGLTLIMRPFPSRNNTQIQIPVMANETFFAGSTNVISQHDHGSRGIREAHARGKTNTLKLEIPECRTLKIPIVAFQKTDDGIVYRAMEGRTGEGAKLLKRLEQGLADGSTVRTYARSTMWRVE